MPIRLRLGRQRWQLITDLLWNAPLGLQIAKGKTLPDRRWEYLLMPNNLMQIRDQAYELRITEELWEAAYFDQVELLVVDHPEDSRIASNEKVGPPEIATPGTWYYSEQTLAPKITDQQGRDWTVQLSKVDGEYSIAWNDFVCQGLVEPHYLDIELPDNANRNNLQLLLTAGSIRPIRR